MFATARRVGPGTPLPITDELPFRYWVASVAMIHFVRSACVLRCGPFIFARKADGVVEPDDAVNAAVPIFEAAQSSSAHLNTLSMKQI